MARKTKDPMWTVYMLRARRTRIGVVWAPDEETARERAIAEHDIRPEEEFRLSVERVDD